MCSVRVARVDWFWLDLYELGRKRSSVIVDHMTAEQKAAAMPTAIRANSPKATIKVEDDSTSPRNAS